MTAALDALARFDDGLPALPGDTAAMAAYERQCQAAHDRREYAAYLDERDGWLAGQCGECVEDGYGPPCDEHLIAEDARLMRLADV